jgi:hypothetical protein
MALHTSGGSALGGRRITSEQRSGQLADAGRICGEAGCDTRLSVYNDLDFCSLHQPMIVPRMRGRILDN